MAFETTSPRQRFAAQSVAAELAWPFQVAVYLLAALALASYPAQAQEAPAAKPAEEMPRVGQLLQVKGAITDKVDQRIRRTVDTAMREAKRQHKWPVFIIELSSGRTDFGQAYDLARYLSSPALSGATTVAYINQPLNGHNVLVAMACDEIVMRPDAEIGDAGKNESAIEPLMRRAYGEIADRRKTIPHDVAEAMLDPSAELVEIATDVSREYVLASRLDELRKEKPIRVVKTIKRPGQPALFTGAQGREMGIVNYLAQDRLEVAKLWKLPRDVLQEDASFGGEWRAARFDIKGVLSAEELAKLQNLVRTKISEQGLNLICLWIDSPGGAPGGSMELANYLAELPAGKIRTIAYVPHEARGDAAFIALACDQIIMHPTAVLGGAGASVYDEAAIPLIKQSLNLICVKKLRSPSLAAAMVDDKLAVYRCVRTRDGVVEYLSDEALREIERNAGGDKWRKEEEVTTRGHLLKVAGHQGEELGLASGLVDSFAELKASYGLEADPHLIEPTWATTLIDALRSPGVTWFLLFLGAAALYAELQSPGIGLGGIVGAVCFMLYFWAQYLGGTAGWLEVLLFLGGIVCLALEFFVFPGVAVFGLAGGLMIISSVILASQTFVLPRNEYQVLHLQTTLTVMVTAAMAAIAAAVLMNRYLPHTPMFNRMLLAPPKGNELSELAQRESLVHWDHLIGQHGTTVTPLLPSGKAQFGDDLIDVIAEGQFIDRNHEVVVVQARGNRIVVRQADA
ncbi:MAG: hypothetical protein JSS27_09685 [Planctomycetes bacterium]|nr:hypothetical protein [Planctomycetota bacterium]